MKDKYTVPGIQSQIIKGTVLIICLFFWAGQFQLSIADTSATRQLGQPIGNGQQTIPLWKRTLAEIKDRAESGDANAQAVLAERYMNGLGVYHDYKKAAKWAKKSTEQKNPLGAYVLSILYSEGNGVGKNHRKMYELQKTYLDDIMNMALEGDAMALDLYGYAYLFGVVVERSHTSALTVFEKSADQGFADAYKNIGDIYDSGKDVKRDLKKAFDYTQQAAFLGHVHAQFNLGIKYENGKGVEKDNKKAFEWYLKAAEKGQVIAQSNLAYIYLDGLGIPKNYERALFWYKKAAEHGEKKAENGIGTIYAKGQGVKQDYQTAIFWFKRSANHGDRLACRNLGILYENGWGVEKNCKKAIEWYEKSKKLGYRKADLYIKHTKLSCE